MSELSLDLSKAIIVPAAGLQIFSNRHAVFGNAAIIAAVLPKLSINERPQKNLRMLSPADDFMWQETTDIFSHIMHKCYRFGIEKEEFKLNLEGQECKLSCQLAQHQQLISVLQQDRAFMDKINWLYVNYLALANSLEWLYFADNYELSRSDACRHYAHLQQNNLGLRCCFTKRVKHVELVFESPVNLFKVSLN